MSAADATHIAIVTGAFSVGGALAAALIAGFFAWLNARSTAERQLEIDRLADQRRMRDAKRDRVRAAAKALLEAAVTMNDTLVDQQFLTAAETERQRDARLLERWRRVMPTANAALLELSLDIDTDEVLHTFGEIRSAYQRCLSGLATNDEVPNTVPVSEIAKHRDDVSAGVARLQDLLRQRTSELETAI